MLDSCDRKGSPLQRKSKCFEANRYPLGRRKRFRFLGVRSISENLHHSILIKITIKLFEIKQSSILSYI